MFAPSIEDLTEMFYDCLEKEQYELPDMVNIHYLRKKVGICCMDVKKILHHIGYKQIGDGNFTKVEINCKPW